MRRRVLQCAALGEWDAVQAAVETAGCNPNIQDEETGLTLVHWAAFQGEEARLQWLLDIGAHSRLKDKRGKTALSGAKGAAADLLLQRGFSAAERVVYARGPPTVARLEQELGGAGADLLDEPLWDEGGARLAAVLASRHGAQPEGGGDGALDALPLLCWLKERGADLEALDEERNGLLHMVDWSVGAGAALPLVSWALGEGGVGHRNLRNSEGDTPALLCASESPSGEDALRCLEAFEAAGLNLSLGNAKGMNVAMVLARYQGDGPWIAWCQNTAGIDPGALCKKGRTVSDYLALHGAEESD